VIGAGDDGGRRLRLPLERPYNGINEQSAVLGRRFVRRTGGFGQGTGTNGSSSNDDAVVVPAGVVDHGAGLAA
jgi:hypothetical protein